MKNKFIVFPVSIMTFQTAIYAYENNFSCNYGKQAACLDYGDKVCSSFSKCVSNDTVCFDSYTCNYQGFVCKSVYQELADEYDNIIEKYNRLNTEYQVAIDKYNSLVSKRNMKMPCLNGASTMADVQNCLLY